jgi:muramoyltetrapeptide carboxypeptidase
MRFMKRAIQVLSLLIVSIVWGQSVKSSSYMNRKDLVAPPFLKAGDTVAIVAPSGILKSREEEVNQSKSLLESWGLKVLIGAHVFEQNNHFAGTDSQRASDLQQALDDPSISAIWCARGGYGTVRILDLLDFTKFKKHPKWLIGYSDITALHNQLNNEGVQSIHALMCVSLTEDLNEIQASVDTFKTAVFGEELSYELEGSDYNREGRATGQLVGGNLTMLHTMLGSETSINTDGKILFIEEIGEYKYHIDRMLQSLKRAGYFDNCAGLIVGDMSKLRKNTTLWGSSIEQLILDALSDCEFPIAFNMPAGHEKDNRALILGTTIELEVTKAQSRIKF